MYVFLAVLTWILVFSIDWWSLKHIQVQWFYSLQRMHEWKTDCRMKLNHRNHYLKFFWLSPLCFGELLKSILSQQMFIMEMKEMIQPWNLVLPWNTSVATLICFHSHRFQGLIFQGVFQRLSKNLNSDWLVRDQEFETGVK